MDPTLVTTLKTQLENQFLTGGIAVVAFTALLATLRHVPANIFRLLKRRFLTVIDLADHDPAFFWVERWLSQQPSIINGHLFTISTRTRPASDRNEATTPLGEHVPRKRRLTEVIWAPAPGLHLLRTSGHYILLEKTRHQVENIAGAVSYHETLTFTTRSRDAVRAMILEARDLASPEDSTSLEVWNSDGYRWVPCNTRAIRPLDSVILDGDLMEVILADVHKFLGRRNWYRDHAVPYQRGYLLHGPPGNGKTSVVLAVAGALDKALYNLRIGAATDDSFMSLINVLPEQAIALIEDIDCIFNERKADDASLTFSTFLNGLDGVAAPESRILFMTTNHPEKLDPALMRPGRVDRQFLLDSATPKQASRLFKRFFPDAPPQYQSAFEESVRSNPKELSMAQLQEHILLHTDDPERASVLK